MTDKDSLEEMRQLWLRVMKEVFQTSDEDQGAALAALDRFIDQSDVPPELRNDALGLRGHLRLDAGDYSGARADLLLAHTLAPVGYQRYVHELSLAGVCHAERNPSEALTWYRSALQTCLDADGVSGGTALKNVVALVGGDISQEDMALCRAAIARSWGVLGLPGEAADHDLAAAITKIKAEETRPRS